MGSIMRIRPEQIRGTTGTGYAHLQDQLDHMSSHFSQTFNITAVTRTLTTSQKYTVGAHQLVVFVNGVQQALPDAYSESSDSTILFTEDLVVGDIVVCYILGAGAGFTASNDTRYVLKSDSGGKWVFKEQPAGVLDGVNRSFKLANLPVPGSEMTFYDGVLQFGDSSPDAGTLNDYSIDYATGIITFHASKVPAVTTVLQVTYMKV